jgi:hypothetical protein
MRIIMFLLCLINLYCFFVTDRPLSWFNLFVGIALGVMVGIDIILGYGRLE